MNQQTTQPINQTNQLWSSCPPGGTKLAPVPTRRRPASTTTLSCTHFIANTSKNIHGKIFFKKITLREAICQIKVESRRVSYLLEQLYETQIEGSRGAGRPKSSAAASFGQIWQIGTQPPPSPVVSRHLPSFYWCLLRIFPRDEEDSSFSLRLWFSLNLEDLYLGWFCKRERERKRVHFVRVLGARFLSWGGRFVLEMYNRHLRWRGVHCMNIWEHSSWNAKNWIYSFTWKET